MTVGNITIPSASPNKSGTSTISVTSTGGYTGTVDLTATAASLNANYAISPTSLAIASGATGTATITIETIASDIRRSAGGNLRRSAKTNTQGIAGAAAMFGCIFLLGISGIRKRRWPVLTTLLMLGALSAGLGCGGGGSSGASPAGTYMVTVTAADSTNAAISVSTSFTVTIQ